MHLDGYVLVARQWGAQKVTREQGKIRIAYTVHRTGCAYLKRTVKPIPAPVTPYIGTKACDGCKPDRGYDVGVKPWQ